MTDRTPPQNSKFTKLGLLKAFSLIIDTSVFKREKKKDIKDMDSWPRCLFIFPFGIYNQEKEIRFLILQKQREYNPKFLTKK